MRKTLRPIYTILAVSCVAVLVASQPRQVSEATRPDESHISTHGHYIDLSKPEDLVGWSDHVFIGRVVSEGSPLDPDPMPQTLFRVEVLDSLKGSLPHEVFIDQQVGTDVETGELVGRQGDTLLSDGVLYLFATRTHANGSWETPAALFGNLRLNTQSEIDAVKEVFSTAVADGLPYPYPNPVTTGTEPEAWN